MHALIAPDKFKGSLAAAEVAAHIAAGFVRSGWTTTELPLADGGDGSVDAAIAAGFHSQPVATVDALGRPHDALLAVSGDTTVVEVANTCGMGTLPGQLQPYAASSAGFGLAIRAALQRHPRRLVLALGGSASSDVGVGMLHALGFRFYDAAGAEVEPVTAKLSSIRGVDHSAAVRFDGVELIIASDVINPLCGPDGAATVFGPQKGVSPDQVPSLDDAMRRFAAALTPDSPQLALRPGAGAAGGIGYAAMTLGARVTSGADFFLDLLGFDAQAAAADLVVTGEGSLDEQSVAGKLVAVVCRRAAGTPVAAIVGRSTLGAEPAKAMRLRAVVSLNQLTDADTASDPTLTAQLLEQAGAQVAESFSTLGREKNADERNRRHPHR